MINYFFIENKHLATIKLKQQKSTFIRFSQTQVFKSSMENYQKVSKRSNKLQDLKVLSVTISLTLYKILTKLSVEVPRFESQLPDCYNTSSN